MIDIRKIILDVGMNNLLEQIITYLNDKDVIKNPKAKQLKKDLWVALENYDPRYKEGGMVK